MIRNCSWLVHRFARFSPAPLPSKPAFQIFRKIFSNFLLNSDFLFYFNLGFYFQYFFFVILKISQFKFLQPNCLNPLTALFVSLSLSLRLFNYLSAATLGFRPLFFSNCDVSTFQFKNIFFLPIISSFFLLFWFPLFIFQFCFVSDTN